MTFLIRKMELLKECFEIVCSLTHHPPWLLALVGNADLTQANLEVVPPPLSPHPAFSILHARAEHLGAFQGHTGEVGESLSKTLGGS